MFDQEVINSFIGGYKIEIPSVISLFGSPLISISPFSISFPGSLRMRLLSRKNSTIEWIDREQFIEEYKIFSTDGTWSDPIKIMSNISKQRGWKYGIKTNVVNDINFNSGIGYISSFISSAILAFSLSNDVRLSNSEILQLGLEIQGKVMGSENYIEYVTQLEGRKNHFLLSEGRNRSFRNDVINLEPFSMYLIEENSLEENNNLSLFRRYKKRFADENMIKKNINQLNYPYSSMAMHFSKEENFYRDMVKAVEKNDIITLLNTLSSYSQSLMFNLNVISTFQKIMGELLLKNGAQFFSFNLSEYSGSILLFADLPLISKIKESVIRQYYLITNKTVSIREINIDNPISYEKVIV